VYTSKYKQLIKKKKNWIKIENDRNKLTSGVDLIYSPNNNVPYIDTFFSKVNISRGIVVLVSFRNVSTNIGVYIISDEMKNEK